jgi:hypothetical protein
MITLVRPYHPSHKLIQKQEISISSEGTFIDYYLPSDDDGAYYYSPRMKAWVLSVEVGW